MPVSGTKPRSRRLTEIGAGSGSYEIRPICFLRNRRPLPPWIARGGGRLRSRRKRARDRAALTETVEALERAIEQGSHGQEDLVAEELRLAARRLGRITGRVDVEDILDVIFRDFCIGK